MDNIVIFFFKQKTAYEMRMSDWSSDVCSSDLSCAAIRQPTRAKGMDTSKYDESERFKQGLQVRREVLGDEYVKPAIERGDKDEFQRALQQFATEDCWGSVWCRPGLDRKTRDRKSTRLNSSH